MKKSNNKIWEIFSYIIITVGLLFAFMGLSEFYNVELGGKESAYAFGAGDNVDNWLYQTASNYSSYMLTSGLLFLFASVITLVGKLKGKKKITIIGISTIILLFFVNLFI